MLPKRCSSCPVNPFHELIFDYLFSVAWRRKRAATLYSRIFSIKWNGILQSIKGTNADITVNKATKKESFNLVQFSSLYCFVFSYFVKWWMFYSTLKQVRWILNQITTNRVYVCPLNFKAGKIIGRKLCLFIFIYMYTLSSSPKVNVWH